MKAGEKTAWGNLITPKGTSNISESFLDKVAYWIAAMKSKSMAFMGVQLCSAGAQKHQGQRIYHMGPTFLFLLILHY